MKFRIQNPGARDAERDFQPLHQQAGEKIGKAKCVGQLFIGTPVKPADNGDNQNLLPQISNTLEEQVCCGKPKLLKKIQKTHKEGILSLYIRNGIF